MIYDPVTIKRGSTVQDALDIMAEYKIGGIPVVDSKSVDWLVVTNLSFGVMTRSICLAMSLSKRKSLLVTIPTK